MVVKIIMDTSLFGVTNCSDEELEAINKIRGSNRGSCNSSGGGSEAANGILDQIFTKADLYFDSKNICWWWI